MTFRRSLMLALLAGSALSLSACESNKKEPTGSLTHHLKMIDKEGRHYGRLELDPVGGGRMYDTEGRMIGTIHSVSPTPLAPVAP